MLSHLARMRQTVIEGEVVAVTFELIKDDARVKLHDGDAFFTIDTKVNPWEAR